jgi:hypothetical protein
MRTAISLTVLAFLLSGLTVAQAVRPSSSAHAGLVASALAYGRFACRGRRRVHKDEMAV